MDFPGPPFHVDVCHRRSWVWGLGPRSHEYISLICICRCKEKHLIDVYVLRDSDRGIFLSLGIFPSYMQMSAQRKDTQLTCMCCETQIKGFSPPSGYSSRSGYSFLRIFPFPRIFQSYMQMSVQRKTLNRRACATRLKSRDFPLPRDIPLPRNIPLPRGFSLLYAIVGEDTRSRLVGGDYDLYYEGWCNWHT